MSEECQCALVEDGSILVCPVHYMAMKENSYLNFKTTPSPSPTAIFMIGNTPCVLTDTHDARDHPCLKDGPEHNWFDLNEQYKKCSKCGMSYEKPASKDFVF